MFYIYIYIYKTTLSEQLDLAIAKEMENSMNQLQSKVPPETKTLLFEDLISCHIFFV